MFSASVVAEQPEVPHVSETLDGAPRGAHVRNLLLLRAEVSELHNTSAHTEFTHLPLV